MGDKGKGKDKGKGRKAPKATRAAGRRPHELRRLQEGVNSPR